MQHYSVSLTARFGVVGSKSGHLKPSNIGFSARPCCTFLPHDCVCIEALRSRRHCVANQLDFPSISNASCCHSRPGSGSCTALRAFSHCVLLLLSPLCPGFPAQDRIGSAGATFCIRLACSSCLPLTVLQNCSRAPHHYNF